MNQYGHGPDQGDGRMNFHDWDQHLEAAPLSSQHRKSFGITIRWYLGFCRRSHAGVSFQSARSFIDWATEEKSPEPWKLEQWKEAIRWFFRTGRSAGGVGGDLEEPDAEVWIGSDALADWELAALTMIRRRRYAYKTEQSYLGWIRRFAGAHSTADLAELGEPDIRRFLDRLEQAGDTPCVAS